jgi:type III pantothenate kinase
MLLALDAGNTHLHVGVFAGAELTRVFRARTDRDRTADEHAVLLRGFLDLAGPAGGFGEVAGVAVSCVVPALEPVLRAAVPLAWGRPAAFAGTELRPPLTVRYSPPEAVGADRLTASFAAFRLYGGPVAVVDCGTATTFDAVSAGGEFLGGAIAPGLGLSLEALSRTASHLPRVAPARPASAIGGSTLEGLRSGAYYGFIGQVEGLLARFREELGPGLRTVATGGFGHLLTDVVQAVEPNLTLTGLRLLWEEQGGGR